MQEQQCFTRTAVGVPACSCRVTHILLGQPVFLATVACMIGVVLQEVKASPDELSVKVSQFEVYNEQIFDLLAEEAGAVLGHRPALRLKEDSQGRIFVRDLSEVPFLLFDFALK